jgi:hypothetical protein
LRAVVGLPAQQPLAPIARELRLLLRARCTLPGARLQEIGSLPLAKTAQPRRALAVA